MLGFAFAGRASDLISLEVVDDLERDRLGVVMVGYDQLGYTIAMRRWLDSLSHPGPPGPVPVEGMLEPAILLLLLERPTNGYALWQELADGDLVAGRVHVGRVYETLARLEDRGFIEEFGSAGRQRNYRVTLTGRGRLKHWIRGLDQSAARIASLVQRARQLEEGGWEKSRELVAEMRKQIGADEGVIRGRSTVHRQSTKPERRNPMTYVIAEPCIGTKDRSCVDVCPVDCIHDDGDEDKILYINPEECIDCGACEPACPVTAIFVDYDVPEQWAGYTDVNSLWFKDKAAARARVDELVAATGG